MGISRLVRCLLCFALLFALLGSLVGGSIALATQEGSSGSFSLLPNQEQPPTEEKLELDATYPVLEAESGDSFEFEVVLKWSGSEDRTFDLATTVPLDWAAIIKPSYGEIRISAIRLEPGKEYPDRIKVVVAPLAGKEPDVGAYVVTLEAASGKIKETVELKVVVVAKYVFEFFPAEGRYSDDMTAGEENHLSCIVQNRGTAAIENINFLSHKYGITGWEITFNPEKIESLEPDSVQEVDVVITPPRKTVPGDYRVSLYANGKQANDNFEFRVTVLTSAIGGWVGILIVVVVIAGLAVMFRKLGRR